MNGSDSENWMRSEGGRVNPVPVTPSWLKAEVLKATLDLP